MYLVKRRKKTGLQDREVAEVIAETQEEVVDVIKKFSENGEILEEVTGIPDCQTAKEYLKENEKPKDLVYGK
ncbi:MAG: hypothetical protein ACOC56_07015, partial [Atribacterota bacterium]